MFTIENLKKRKWRGQTLGRVQADILYVLHFRNNDAVPMHDIIDFVYPDIDKEPIDPRGTITVVIHNLRKKFGSEIIISEGHRGYQIGEANV